MLAEKKVAMGEVGAASMIEWSSRKIRRVVRSSLAAEVHGLSMSAESASWARTLCQEIANGFCNLTAFREHFQSEPMITCIDCNSMFGHFYKMGGAAATADKRTRIGLRVLKQCACEDGVQLRWIDGQLCWPVS